jgi:hypothetical protein
MKRITVLLIAIFAVTIINAQDITDGLRYSLDRSSGTARFNALSGAFGALGGDLSAVGINPAGSAVFINSTAAVTIAADDTENKASYFNTNTKSINTDVNLNQAGGVFLFKNSSETSNWKKFSISVNYQATQNYDNELFIKGKGNTSIDQFFLAQAQGVPLELLQLQSGESNSDLYAYLGNTEGVAAQNAFLGYQGFIIEPVDPDNPLNTEYFSNIGDGTFNQEYAYITQGANNKFTVNFATQVTDKFYFGINLNSHAITYDQSTFLYEDNSNSGSTVNQVGFENNLSVQGSGFSAQIGAIAKLQDNFRVGLSLESPTWYEISEETTQYLETSRIENGLSIIQKINPRILNVYENYYLRTPGKVTASAAYIFGNQGLISFDYSFKDYSSIQFDAYNYDYDPYFNTVNNSIENSLTGVSSYRIGGEYRIKQVSLRGGFQYEESPYQNNEIIGDTSGFSLGFGYNFGKFNFDLSYVRAEQKRKQQLYTVGLTDSTTINTTSTNIAFTLGFKL